MAADGMYVDFSTPLRLYSLVQDVISKNATKHNTPEITLESTQRVWVSQPRTAAVTLDPALTDVVTINFKEPSSVSEIGFEALQVSCNVELWYLDRLNNWRQVLDESRVPALLNLTVSHSAAWHKAHFYCYPFIAKALQWRFTRVFDLAIGNQPFCVGMRNGLIRRNIYIRADAIWGIDPEVDTIGNTSTSYIKDWDATKAIDNAPTTFWKSPPMPDPAAVASLYLDMRDPGGAPQLIDTLYLDPVYTGQTLNIYYSNDDTVGVRKLSPVTQVADTDTNTTWKLSKGRWDSSAPGGSSAYKFPMAWGPLVNQPAWIGIEWTPDFNPGYSNEVQLISLTGDPSGGTFTIGFGANTTAPIPFDASPLTVQSALTALASVGAGNVGVAGLAGGPWPVTFRGALGGQNVSSMIPHAGGLIGGGAGVTVTTTTPGGVSGGPANDPVLFAVTPPASHPVGQFWPVISYDVSAGQVVLTLTDGTTTHTYTATLSPLFAQYAALRLVVGWRYEPHPVVFLSIKTPTGVELGPGTTITASTLPTNITLDGHLGFSDFRGLFTAHVVKLEPWTAGQASFQANPSMYVSPDPVLPDATGTIPSTTLDNAIYAAAWAVQEHGTGGCHATNFEEKTWTPVWRDYISQKGKLFFPQQISCKYLKLEFTDLTEEPYPVYDSGIQVHYQTFPVAVVTIATKPLPPGQVKKLEELLTVGGDVSMPPVGSVNWLNPSTVNAAVNSIFGQAGHLMSITGAGFNTTTLPNTVNLDLAAQTRQEVSSPWVYRRGPQSAAVLAGQLINVSSSVDTAQSGAATLQAQALGVSSDASAASFTPVLNHAAVLNTLPQQGSDWWVFPGGTLRLPASTMKGLTGLTAVITHRKVKIRVRFIGTCVHRYDTKTVIRDAAVGYFAGVREVQPYVTTYIDYQDPDVFTFSLYDSTQWVQTNIAQLDSGPVTTAGSLYTVNNATFDKDIGDWLQIPPPLARPRFSPHPGSQGHGTLSAAAALALIRVPASRLGGTGALSAVTAATGFTLHEGGRGSGVLSAIVSPKQREPLTGRGTLHALTRPRRPTTVHLSSAGTLHVATYIRKIRPTAVITGHGILSALIESPTHRAGTLHSRGQLSATAVHHSTRSVGTLTGRGTLSTVIRHFRLNCPAPLSGHGALSAGVRARKVHRNVTMRGQGVLTASTQFGATATTAGVGQLTAIAHLTRSRGAPALQGHGALSATVSAKFPRPTSWIWDGTLGHWYLGSATIVAESVQKELLSSAMEVSVGAHIDASAWVHWEGLSAVATSEAIQLRAMYYNDTTFVSSEQVTLSYNPWTALTPEVDGNHWAQLVASADLDSGFTVPNGANQLCLMLVVTADAHSGQIWFDEIEIATTDPVEGTLFKDFHTTSTLAKLTCSFTDTGLMRSDDMWAQSDPNDTNISSTALAYYTSTIPDGLPAGMWGDTFADWGDSRIVWGNPRQEVAIQVDPDRVFQGKRVLHFSRAGGAEEAGVKVRQITNFVAGGLFRIGCVFFKPEASTNQVTIRLRRLNDGVYIYEETFDPVSGFWYEYVTQFLEIPDTEEQQYTVELVLTGDQPDEFFLNDLYCDIAAIRYFVRLGGGGAFLHDVTPLRYAGQAVVTATTPVQEFSVQAAILSPRAYAYGCTLIPTYLK